MELFNNSNNKYINNNNNINIIPKSYFCARNVNFGQKVSCQSLTFPVFKVRTKAKRSIIRLVKTYFRGLQLMHGCYLEE